MFKTISENVSAEIVEKKSKFIANIFYVESQEAAEEKIKEVKKKYFDAKHNCFAYSIFSKEGITNRFSDDGEPSGTAGAPMLNILTSKQITNILVVVTRYFGGILLGTGGLIRAYTEAVQEALNKINIIEKDIGLEVKFEIEYSDFEKFKYYMKQNNIKIIDTNYLENVFVTIETPSEKLEKIKIEKENYNLNFNIINMEILKEKYIENNMSNFVE